LKDSPCNAAVRRLPPRQRAVIALRYLADLSESQTAAALGCSVGTVKGYTARALAALRVDPAVLDLRRRRRGHDRSGRAPGAGVARGGAAAAAHAAAGWHAGRLPRPGKWLPANDVERRIRSAAWSGDRSRR
jgi:hypothetical protein